MTRPSAQTGACRSAITYVDGDEGVLLYRGYPIDQLVERCDYLEVALAAAQRRAAERRAAGRNSSATSPNTRCCNEQLHTIYRGFRRDSHPMAVMCGVVGALAAFYHDSLDIFDPRHRLSPRTG